MLNKILKGVLTVLVLGLFQTGCAPAEKYVKLVEESQIKTTMVYIEIITQQLVFNVTKDGIEITASTVTATGGGSGVYISPNGHILTAAHLFRDDVQKIVVNDLSTGEHSATLLEIDEQNDLALLKVDVSSPTPYGRIADPRKLKVGQEVFAIGQPAFLEWTVTHGIISALNRDGQGFYNHLQTDTPLNPGNSGGPLFNMKGEIVGIVSWGIPRYQNLSFCVESGQIVKFLVDIRRKYQNVEKGLPRLRSDYWKGFLAAIGVED